MIEASKAGMWANISSTKASCVDSIRVLAIGGVVEAIINLGVGSEP